MKTQSTEFRIPRLNDREVHSRVLGAAAEQGSPVFQHTLIFGEQLSSSPEHRDRLQLILEQETIGVQHFRFDFPTGVSVTVSRDSIRNGSAWLLKGHRDKLTIYTDAKALPDSSLTLGRIREALGAVDIPVSAEFHGRLSRKTAQNEKRFISSNLPCDRDHRQRHTKTT